MEEDVDEEEDEKEKVSYVEKKKEKVDWEVWEEKNKGRHGTDPWPTP